MSDEQKIVQIEAEAKELVKRAGSEGVSPSTLIRKLSRTDFDEDLVRMAIWDLLDQQELGLSRDWVLSIKSG